MTCGQLDLRFSFIRPRNLPREAVSPKIVHSLLGDSFKLLMVLDVARGYALKLKLEGMLG